MRGIIYKMNQKLFSTLNGIGQVFLYLVSLNLLFLQPSSLFRTIAIGGLGIGLLGTVVFLFSRMNKK